MSNVIPFPQQPRWRSVRVRLELGAKTLHRLNRAAREHGGSFDRTIAAALDALDAASKPSPETTDPPATV